MSDDIHRRYRSRPDTAERLRGWLLARPTECWLFLFAGMVVGAILG